MPIRDCIERVLHGYLAAREQPFAKHELAHFLRHDFAHEAAKASLQSDRFEFQGSAGQGNWARGPWVCVLDPVITNTPQRGFYPVYLFREDMNGLYLSLNQGMTEFRQQYKSDAKTALRARSANFRAMLGDQINGFPILEINLAPSNQSNDTAFYEAGNICAKYYPRESVPNDDVLTADLAGMLQLYTSLAHADTDNGATGSTEGDEPPTLSYEDASKFRFHKRIERNANLAKKVKATLGFVCQICRFDFKKKYGALGEGYIEAHHRRSLASMKGQKIAMDPRSDFAVLCSNCHRMVHRSGCLDDIAAFEAQYCVK